MFLLSQIKHVFGQIGHLLQDLPTADYSAPCPSLSNATIGQHVRHIIELFICLENGYSEGIVNYENRRRDRRIETDKEFAGELFVRLHSDMDQSDKGLLLQTLCGKSSDVEYIATNYYRELLFNLEHTVHHMALIRIGVADLHGPFLPEDFGVASSTMRYRKASA
jgi:hypothetical protein